MFLGFARGKVGDVVFTRANGEQVTRVRNREPKNPKTPRQGVQRATLKTVSQAYSVLAPICDHSFEGLQLGTPNQSRFAQLNIDFLRTRILESVNLSDDAAILASDLPNFSPALISSAVINEYYVSEGSLPQMTVDVVNHIPRLSCPGLTDSPSYAQLVEALGAEEGDQLTFIYVWGDDASGVAKAGLITGVEFARVILQPASGPMSTNFIGVDGKPQAPNPANSGRVIFDYPEVEGQYLTYAPATGASTGTEGGDKVLLGTAVILSRRFGGQWRRSTQQLVVDEDWGNDPWAWELGDAVYSFMATPAGSSLYLNQATNV